MLISVREPTDKHMYTFNRIQMSKLIKKDMYSKSIFDYPIQKIGCYPYIFGESYNGDRL